MYKIKLFMKNIKTILCMPLKINNIKSLTIKLCKTYIRIKVSLGISVLNSNEIMCY